VKASSKSPSTRDLGVIRDGRCPMYFFQATMVESRNGVGSNGSPGREGAARI